MGHNRAASGASRPTENPHEDALLSIIQAAGWPIWPLILCSVVALALVIERLYQPARQRWSRRQRCWTK